MWKPGRSLLLRLVGAVIAGSGRTVTTVVHHAAFTAVMPPVLAVTESRAIEPR
jgi:hypothetical protein